jgi:hypothetical protein
VGDDALSHLIFDIRDPDLARGGGLRAGRYRIDGHNRLHLDEIVFVPGVRVSGFVRRFGSGRQEGRLRLSGGSAPPGVLTLRGRRVRGKLGGRRLWAVLSTRASASTIQASAARLR